MSERLNSPTKQKSEANLEIYFTWKRVLFSPQSLSDCVSAASMLPALVFILHRALPSDCSHTQLSQTRIEIDFM